MVRWFDGHIVPSYHLTLLPPYLLKWVVKIKNNDEIKNKIIEFLKTASIGASSTDIAKSINHNRITISKYLEILKAEDIVSYQEIAQAKLWKLNESMQKPSILIVDDEPHVVNLVKLSLAPNRYNVFEAYSGNEALEIIRKNQIDLIVLDLMMPGMSGYDVCRQIKTNALTSRIHVLILSAKGELNDKINGIEVGADDYITKPFDPLELEARIDIILEHTPEDKKHPLTKLPTKPVIESHLHQQLMENNDFCVYNFRLSKLENYAEKHGYKKLNNLLVLFTRLINNSLLEEKESFIGHTINNNFVVFTKIKKMDKEITESFQKMLPYIHEGGNVKNPVILDVKKLSRSDIMRKGLEMKEIIKELMIE